MNRTWFALLLSISVGFATEIHAESNNAEGLPQPNPKVCVGYDNTDQLWGFYTLGTMQRRTCSTQSAYLGVKSPLAGRLGPESVPAAGNCCPLPISDILTDVHVVVLDRCPDGFVATGGDLDTGCATCSYELRCTKVNQARYQLGEPVPGIAWGASNGYFWQEPERIKRIDLPVSVRYGLVRARRSELGTVGCVGSPIGSLLVGKSSRRCTGFEFQQLRYRGLPGDPPKGTPVVMFPECSDISDLFDPSAECIR